MQMDVVAVNWQQKVILLGECKWGADAVGLDVLRDLIEVKSPKALRDLPGNGEGWQVRHALFARAGFTDATQAAAAATGVHLVDLPALEAGL